MKRKLLFLMAFICFSLQLHAVEPLTNDFEENDYTGNWGKLKLVGNQLSSECGDSIQLRGWSTQDYNATNVGRVTFNSEDGFRGMKKFGANVVRIAAHPTNNSNRADENLDWVKRCMAYTKNLGMYCIVDYHVLDNGDPLQHFNDPSLLPHADDFFRQITQEAADKNYTHILYEICNEPSNKGLTNVPSSLTTVKNDTVWNRTKRYAAEILPIISAKDPNAVVIIGTPSSSQRVDYPAGTSGRRDITPLSLSEDCKDLNIMYAFHYYACSHKDQFENYLKPNTSKIPVFATEWSRTKYTGNDLCTDSTVNSNIFMEHCKENKISWTSWNWSTKEELSAALKRGVDPPYSISYTYDRENNLSLTGAFVADYIAGDGYIGSTIPDCLDDHLSKIQSVLFGIYPNPAKNGVFEVSLKDGQKADLSILNLQSQPVYRSRIENGSATIKTALPAGVYVVSVKNENGTGIQKLIIQ